MSSAPAVDGVRPPLCSQLTKLAANPAVAGLCGELHINNYVIVLPRRGVDAAASAAAIAQTTCGLNTADLLLLEWCEQLITEVRCSSTHTMCREWRRHFESNENLIGATFAIHLFHQLSQTTPLGSLLATARPDIVLALRNTEPAVRDICRLNGFVPLRVVDAMTGLLLSELDRTGALAAVERLEVAKDFGPEVSGSPVAAPEFPTLMLYLRAEASARHVELALDTFVALTSGVARQGVPPPQFAIPIGSAATLTQGFRLFKHYLHPLGLLDTIYDAGWNHALTATPAEPPVAHATALRQLLRKRATDAAGGRRRRTEAP